MSVAGSVQTIGRPVTPRSGDQTMAIPHSGDSRISTPHAVAERRPLTILFADPDGSGLVEIGAGHRRWLSAVALLVARRCRAPARASHRTHRPVGERMDPGGRPGSHERQARTTVGTVAGHTTPARIRVRFTGGVFLLHGPERQRRTAHPVPFRHSPRLATPRPATGAGNGPATGPTGGGRRNPPFRAGRRHEEAVLHPQPAPAGAHGRRSLAIETPATNACDVPRGPATVADRLGDDLRAMKRSGGAARTERRTCSGPGPDVFRPTAIPAPSRAR